MFCVAPSFRPDACVLFSRLPNEKLIQNIEHLKLKRRFIRMHLFQWWVLFFQAVCCWFTSFFFYLFLPFFSVFVFVRVCITTHNRWKIVLKIHETNCILKKNCTLPRRNRSSIADEWKNVSSNIISLVNMSHADYILSVFNIFNKDNRNSGEGRERERERGSA